MLGHVRRHYARATVVMLILAAGCDEQLTLGRNAGDAVTRGGDSNDPGDPGRGDPGCGDSAPGDDSATGGDGATAGDGARGDSATGGDPALGGDDSVLGDYLVTPLARFTTEQGQYAAFTVALTRAPVADVVVTYASSDATEGDVDPTSLVFTPANYDSPQTVKVIGQDDGVADGNQAYAVVFASSTSTDLAYDATVPGPDVPLLNIDDDSGICVTGPISGNVTEAGGTATFGVVLTGAPTADVRLYPVSDDPSEGLVPSAPLLFTPTDWSVPQFVTVTGQVDVILDGDQPFRINFFPTVSEDPAYDETLPPPVFAVNIDVSGDPGYAIGPISGDTSEDGGTATFSVSLCSMPRADVILHFDTNDPSEGAVAETSLVFTPNDWNARKPVLVTGQDDAVFDGDQSYSITFAPTESADFAYASTMPWPDVSAVNLDDDDGLYVVSPIDGHTSEDGRTASFTVVLNAQPTADVTVSFASDDPGEGEAAVSSLVFTPADWDVPQPVSVVGRDDALLDGHRPYTIVFAPSVSTDPTHDGAIPGPDVSVVNLDDDIPSYAVGTASTATTESGGTATFTVVLDAPPSAAVTVRLKSDEPSEGIATAGSVLFSAGDWDIPQVVTVVGQDDSRRDGDQNYAIVFEPTGEPGAVQDDSAPPPRVSMTNLDDDLPGITVSSISGDTTEAGGTATFTVALASEPYFGVSVHLASGDPSEGITSTSHLSFEQTQWDVPQTVTVVGQDDLRADGDQPYLILIQASTGGDLDYFFDDPAMVPVVNRDDD